MNKVKGRNSILWVEAGGFLVVIVMSWLTELFRIPHYLFNEPFIPNWHRAVLRTLVIVGIWLWVFWITRRLLKRLHHLEEFLRICSWCRKVCHMCPDCLKKKVQELSQQQDGTSSQPGNRLKNRLN
jgi:hypothetical protein